MKPRSPSKQLKFDNAWLYEYKLDHKRAVRNIIEVLECKNTPRNREHIKTYLDGITTCKQLRELVIQDQILNIIDDLKCDDTLVNRVHIDNYIKGNYGPKRLHELVHSTHVQRF